MRHTKIGESSVENRKSVRVVAAAGLLSMALGAGTLLSHDADSNANRSPAAQSPERPAIGATETSSIPEWQIQLDNEEVDLVADLIDDSQKLVYNGDIKLTHKVKGQEDVTIIRPAVAWTTNGFELLSLAENGELSQYSEEDFVLTNPVNGENVSLLNENGIINSNLLITNISVVNDGYVETNFPGHAESEVVRIAYTDLNQGKTHGDNNTHL
ncbi:hypothetical protein KDA00_02775 [Candidatus Saccharibacteria bacterium]|nr:hypothetical protein [Candidatus Saccharibacteria bacterium]